MNSCPSLVVFFLVFSVLIAFQETFSSTSFQLPLSIVFRPLNFPTGVARTARIRKNNVPRIMSPRSLPAKIFGGALRACWLLILVGCFVSHAVVLPDGRRVRAWLEQCIGSLLNCRPAPDRFRRSHVDVRLRLLSGRTLDFSNLDGDLTLDDLGEMVLLGRRRCSDEGSPPENRGSPRVFSSSERNPLQSFRLVFHPLSGAHVQKLTRPLESRCKLKQLGGGRVEVSVALSGFDPDDPHQNAELRQRVLCALADEERLLAFARAWSTEHIPPDAFENGEREEPRPPDGRAWQKRAVLLYPELRHECLSWGVWRRKLLHRFREKILDGSVAVRSAFRLTSRRFFESCPRRVRTRLGRGVLSESVSVTCLGFCQLVLRSIFFCRRKVDKISEVCSLSSTGTAPPISSGTSAPRSSGGSGEQERMFHLVRGSCALSPRDAVEMALPLHGRSADWDPDMVFLEFLLRLIEMGNEAPGVQSLFNSYHGIPDLPPGGPMYAGYGDEEEDAEEDHVRADRVRRGGRDRDQREGADVSCCCGGRCCGGGVDSFSLEEAVRSAWDVLVGSCCTSGDRRRGRSCSPCRYPHILGNWG